MPRVDIEGRYGRKGKSYTWSKAGPTHQGDDMWSISGVLCELFRIETRLGSWTLSGNEAAFRKPGDKMFFLTPFLGCDIIYKRSMPTEVGDYWDTDPDWLARLDTGAQNDLFADQRLHGWTG